MYFIVYGLPVGRSVHYYTIVYNIVQQSTIYSVQYCFATAAEAVLLLVLRPTGARIARMAIYVQLSGHFCSLWLP